VAFLLCEEMIRANTRFSLTFRGLHIKFTTAGSEKAQVGDMSNERIPQAREDFRLPMNPRSRPTR